MPTEDPRPSGFDQFDLPSTIQDALRGLQHETPTSIQVATIPDLLAGRDMIAQAHTGTGKTAAFALPLLTRIDLSRAQTQALVLTPTRELAIQVAEAIRGYGAGLKGLRVLTVYGGQEYGEQIRGLRAGSHVVVGTPGRVMDHMRRNRLTLDKLNMLVLDEADEMLAMGFVEDIEWILEQAPAERQIALFSATIPGPIRRIATRHLRDPRQVSVRAQTATAATINQRYWLANSHHKLDALTRILEIEDTEGVLIFVQTKAATVALAKSLESRNFTCAPLSGDVVQKTREETVARLKRGDLDIIVATDVAARGLDVDRIGHVINYEMPRTPEAYVHRIGRTGRAGRAGHAILFVSARETHMLRTIERATNQRITRMNLPTVDDVNERRLNRYVKQIAEAIKSDDLAPFRKLAERVQSEHGADPLDIAAALAQLAHGDGPLLLPPERRPALTPRTPPRSSRAPHGTRPGAPARDPRGRGHAGPSRDMHGNRARSAHRKSNIEFESFRVEVGRAHGVEPGNIVGAIANEADLDRSYIGRIEINEDHTILDMPVGMPAGIMRTIQRVWVRGRQLKISRVGGYRTPKRKPQQSPTEKPAPSRPTRPSSRS